MISEKIRELFETKLNDNTYSQKFVLGSYVQPDDDKRDFIYNIRSGYELIAKNYISCMFTPNIDYEPIPNSLTGYATITINFLLYADDKDKFDEQLKATEEIISKVVGNYEEITDDTITYDSVWTIDGLIPNGETRPLNGTIYTQIATTLYVYFSKEFKMGNKYEYYLGVKNGTGVSYSRIYPFDGNEQRQNTENYPHRITDAESKGGNEESSWVAEFPVNVNTFIEENFLADISSETYDMTKEYYYKEIVNDSTTHEFKVVATLMSKPYVIGDIQTIDLKLIKSDIPE